MIDLFLLYNNFDIDPVKIDFLDHCEEFINLILITY